MRAGGDPAVLELAESLATRGVEEIDLAVVLGSGLG